MTLFGKADCLQVYREAFEQTWDDSEVVDNIRFVVLDTETTGLDPRRDRIVTIGAVVVSHGQIMLEDQFEAVIKFDYNTASVVVHGVTREAAQEDGLEEPDALGQFLGYLRDGVIVGHHIGFDVDILSERCRARFGMGLENRWLDTMELTLNLEDAGAFAQDEDDADEPKRPDFSLDGLCRRFNIAPHDRHTAPGDAFITAQVFLKLLRMASRHGMSTLQDISKRWVDPREASPR